MRKILALLILLCAAPAWASAPEQEAATQSGEWRDAARHDRPVPYKIYYPAQDSGPFPVILFSHGLGGNRDGYEYLGRFLAGHGYVVVHVEHEGSNTASIGQMGNKMALARAAIDRFQDVPFVLDQLPALNRGGPLAGKLDLNHIGIAGHSFGAMSAMVAAGQAVGPRARSFKDARIQAALALSPAPAGKRVPDKRAYANIDIPVMSMTGTDDHVSITPDVTPLDRQTPFRRIAQNGHGADAYLLVFAGGDHMLFSGRRWGASPDRPTDDAYHGLIQRAALGFFNAYLKGDSAARGWLRDGGLKQTLGSAATLEIRP